MNQTSPLLTWRRALAFPVLALCMAPAVTPAATVTWDQNGGFSPLSSYISLGEWNTAGNFENWTASNAGTPAVTGGSLDGTSGSPPTNTAAVDPTIQSAGATGIMTLNLDLGSGDHNILEFRLKIGDGVASFDPQRIDIFWGTSAAGSAGFAAARRVEISPASATGALPAWNVPTNSAADGRFHTYQVDMTGVAGWNSTLVALRLDPIAGTVAGGQFGQAFSFDYVRIVTPVPEPGSAALLAGAGLLLTRRRRMR